MPVQKHNLKVVMVPGGRCIHTAWAMRVCGTKAALLQPEAPNLECDFLSGKMRDSDNAIGLCYWQCQYRTITVVPVVELLTPLPVPPALPAARAGHTGTTVVAPVLGLPFNFKLQLYSATSSSGSVT